MTVDTWQIGVLVALCGLILPQNAYFGPILPPVHVWEEVVLGWSAGAYDGCHLVYGTI